MKKANLITVVVFLAVVGFVLSLSPRTMRRVKGMGLDMIAPFLNVGTSIQTRIAEVTRGLKRLDEVEHEAGRLRVENRRLRAENQMLHDLRDENSRLRQSLEYQRRSVFRLIPAQVIGRDATTWWSAVQINRGSNDGLREDMSVLTDEGLVGKTSAVGRTSASVILISDETCKVAVKVEGTREQGILSGERVSNRSSPLLNLGFLSKQAGLRPGQKVYTSGMGGLFPSGVLVGEIRSYEVRELDGLAKVVPAVDLAGLSDLFVVDSILEPQQR